MELPSADKLLRGVREDWVVPRGDQKVLVSGPVEPRPDTLNRIRATIEAKGAERRNLRGEALDRFRQEFNELHLIRLDLLDQVDEAEYLIHIDDVEQIIHHEDLILQRVDLLIRESGFDLAYELLNQLERRTPEWPGAADRHERLLFAEGEEKLSAGDLEGALVTFEEVHQRRPAASGLSERAGHVADALIRGAVEGEQWREARHFLRRLAQMFPQHPVVGNWQGHLAGLAERRLRESEQARSERDHARAADLAAESARLWPATPNFRTRYRVYADRYQQLHVGVIDLPAPERGVPVLAADAQWRHSRLIEGPFFELDRADDGLAHYTSRYCDNWEPLNLGRELQFELRSSRQPWESQPIVTAPVIAERIAARLDPTHPRFDERLAGYAESVQIDSPKRFSVRFRRVPVRPEPLLMVPAFGASASGTAGRAATGLSPVSTAGPEDPEPERVTGGGFPLADLSGDRAVYRRGTPEPEGQRLYRVAEIHEHRYSDHDAVWQALARGEISMAVRLPAWHIDRLRNSEEARKAYFIERMALPVTHVLQFHPRSRPMLVREYRRALMYGIDRARILAGTVLGGLGADLGRLVEGPFPQASYANNALVQSRPYDPLAALSLVFAARKILKDELPPLRMIVQDDPVARAAAREIATGWEKIGVTTTLLDPLPEPLLEPEGTAPRWDVVYRTVQMVEPITELWPFMALTDAARVADLDPFPDWVRQEIIRLDLAGDWNTASSTIKRVHLKLWGEVMFLPLWEVDEYVVYRKNIRGVPRQPVHCYEDVDRWVVEAWYPEDEP
jgi:hypothetical protein